MKYYIIFISELIEKYQMTQFSANSAVEDEVTSNSGKNAMMRNRRIDLNLF